MSLKIKFLIISLEVLTIFVKMVPAFSRVIGIQKPIQTTIPSDENQIHCNTLIKITDLCQTKIEAYSKPFEFETANSSAALLYIKDTLYRYNTYHYPIEHISANLLTQYLMLMQNNDAESDLKDEFARFKRIKEQDLRSQYEVVTSCRLNEKIIAEIYFWEYFKVVYYLTKAQHILKGNSRFPVEELMNTLETKQAIVEDNETLDFQFTSDTYLKFIELYKEELNLQFSNGETLETHIILMTRNFDTQDPNVVKARQYLIDQYHIFTRIWELYQFNLHLFLTYKILDKKIPAGKYNTRNQMSSNPYKKKTTGLTPFLEHFKESLDYNYYIHTGMNIAMLSEDRQIMYYYNTLRTLRIIVTSYYSEQPNTFKVYDEDHKDSDLIGIAPDDMETFVSLLTYVAKDIKNTDNFKQMPHQLKEKYLEKMDVCSKNQNDLITIENSYYKCDDSECASELPSTVNIKDVLNYVIANIESIYFRFKTQKDSEEASTNQRPITGRGGDRHDLRKHDY